MKDLIKLIKSDNWLMVIATLFIALVITIIVLLSQIFPSALQVIAIILGVACIVGALTTICVWLFMYHVERACNNDNQKHYSQK
jgi:hypothetical protein